MNIPQVKHTPRVEAVEAKDETYSVGGFVLRVRDGGGYRLETGNAATVWFPSESQRDALALFAALCGCEVVQRGEPDKIDAPCEPTDAQVEAALNKYFSDHGNYDTRAWMRAALKAAWAVKS